MVYRNCEDYIQKVLPKKRKAKIFYNKHERYARISAGFDIETTRIETRGYMWCWTVTIDGDTCYCRLWSEFERLIEAINYLCDKLNACIIVWVANLGYEFSYIGRRFEWTKLFATDSHEPLIARTGRVEFRECLTISGQGGLKNLAKNYTKTQKMVGDLDYDVIRVSSPEYCTETDEKEDTYVINDTVILSEWGEYIFKQYADKGVNIPLTQTSIVSSAIMDQVKQTGHEKEIKDAVRTLYPSDSRWYNFIMVYLFRGGYTHGSAWWIFVTCWSVIGADFTSSYPAVMLHFDRFPMSPFMETELGTDGKEITDKRMQTHCVWFAANFSGIRRKTIHAIESKHKIVREEGAFYDNGRLVYADRIQVCLTDVDYEIYKMYYTWESLEIKFAYFASRGPLPKYLLDPLKEAYKRKAQLKKAGKDDTIEYKNIKAFINSFYGCCVKRLNFVTWNFDRESGEWFSSPSKKEYERLVKEQALSPFWGIYITALARLCLLKNVYKLDSTYESDNVLYCDTDSIYMQDTPENRKIIEEWNKEIFKQNENLDVEFYDIGAFDWIDGGAVYRFKTLGAKRYIKYHDGVCEVTAAGLPKRALEKMLASPFKKSEDSYIAYKDPKKKTGKIGYVDVNEIFDTFNDGMYLAPHASDKNRAVYNSQPHEENITDKNGVTVHMEELSSCAILPVQFGIHMAPEFVSLINQINHDRRLKFI